MEMPYSIRQVLAMLLICVGFVPVCSAGTVRTRGKSKYPTAFELLDKYSAAADKFQSFILKSETSRKINYTGIQTIVEHRDITEVRYDGDRCFVKMLQWGDRRIKSKEFIPKEKANCVRHLWDGKWWLSYTDSERGAEYDRVMINRTSEGYKGMSTSLDYGSFLRGFFHGGKKGRIDSILRQENSAYVRADMEEIGESDCYVIEADTKHGKYTFWIDPSHGYNIAKAEIQRNEIQCYNHRNGAAPKDVRQFYSLKDVRFKKVQDVWTPVEGHVEQSTYSPRGDVLIEVHHVVTDITLNPDHDSLGSFEPDFIRNGALVGVADVKGIRYRWQDGEVVDDKGRVILDCRPKKASGSAESKPKSAVRKRPSAWELLRKYAEQQGKVTDTQSKERIVHFPPDRSLGKLMVQDENTERIIDAFFYRGQTQWQYFGQARGSVTVPAGKRLALYAGQDAWKDLSPLFSLNPDDLYMLTIYGPYQGGALPDDRCMPYIAHLTGLKVLTLDNTSISAKGVQSLKHLKNLKRLTLSKRATDRTLAEIAGLTSLKGLYLNESRLTNAGLAHLQKLAGLEELALGQGRMTNAGLAHLAKLPRLEYLLLQGNNFTDAGMTHLKNIPSLKILHLGHLPQLTDAALVHLSEIPNLERLSLHRDENITDTGIAHLKKMKSLKMLDIGYARITDKALADLATIGSLDYLHLPNRGFTDESLAHIAKLDKLKYLWICGRSNSPLTDDALRYVAELKSLETLLIAGTGFTDAGMREIAKLPSLKNLNLSAFTNVTNKGLRELAGLKSLKKLYIHGRGEHITISGLSCLNAMPGLVELNARGIVQDNSGLDISGLTNLEKLTLGLKEKRVGKSIVRDMFRDQDMACLAQLKKLEWLQGINGISDIGLEHLSGLTQMERLGFIGPNLTDAGLVHLAKMSKLAHLSIYDGNITDHGLRHLESLPNLAYLNITSRSRISAAAKRRLREKLPNLGSFETQLKDVSPRRPQGTRPTRPKSRR